MSSSLPTLVCRGGGLAFQSVAKADLLSDHFDSKQSRETVDIPPTCHPSHSFKTFAFRSSEVRTILLDFGPYGGCDPLGIFDFSEENMFLLPISVWCFGCFIWVVSLLARDTPMSPQY